MIDLKVLIPGLLVLGCCGVSLAQGTAPGTGDEQPKTGAPDKTPEKGSAGEADREIRISLDAEVNVQTLYNFRGLNLFQHGGQMDQNALISLDVALDVAKTGLWVEYWSGWQISGPNISELIDRSIGAEQDVLAGFDLKLQEDIEAGVFAVLYYYPYSSSIPKTYFEAGAKFTWSTFVEVEFAASYFQPFPDDADNDLYVYLHLDVGKEFPVLDGFTLGGNASFGWKILTEMSDNLLDFEASISGKIILVKDLSLLLTASFAWTDLEGLSASDEIMAWAGAAIQASF